jgi:hypothetical protein
VRLSEAMKRAHQRYAGTPPCPNCGALVLAAEASEYVSDGRVRHWWLCDDCAYDFRTTVKIAS